MLYASAALGGILLAASMPPAGTPFLVWFAFVPVLAAVRSVRGALLRAAMVGAVFGTCFSAVAFAWIEITLERFAEAAPTVAVGGAVLFMFWTGAMFAAWTSLIALGPRRGGPALAWTLLSSVGVFHAWPNLFPFTPIAGISEAPQWLQLASVGGIPLVECVVITVAYALVLVFESKHTRYLWAGVAALVFSGNAVFGHCRLALLDAEAASWPRMRVGVVQPNFAHGARASVRRLTVLQDASADLEASGAELVVWPEAGAYPFTLPRPLVADPAGYRRVLARHRLPTLFGVKTRDARSNAEFNSLILLNRDGQVIGHFDKTRLVPLGENATWLDPAWVQSWLPAASQTTPGLGPVGLPLPYGDDQQAVIGPFICYEDLLSDFGRAVASVPGGVNLFVSVANDAWFGGGRGPEGHAALARFRAVEHGVPMVRAVASGPSEVLDAGGRVIAGLDAHDVLPERPRPAETLLAEVALCSDGTRDPTWFARLGWLLGPLCTLSVVVGAVVFGLGRCRRRN